MASLVHLEVRIRMINQYRRVLENHQLSSFGGVSSGANKTRSKDDYRRECKSNFHDDPFDVTDGRPSA